MSKNSRNNRKNTISGSARPARLTRTAKPAGAGKPARPESLIGVRPDKRLGQNFLTDEDVIAAIIDGSGVTKESLVLEIGPGTGALTLPLAERAGEVIAVELDEDMLQGLRIKTFGMDNVEIVHGDILETDIIALTAGRPGCSELRIIGNLPYYITTPIITKLLEENTGAKSITVMMQKEVGDRIAAEPGTRASGAITYLVHYYAEVTELIDVPRECFYPVPGVDSVVLRLDLRDEPAVRVKSEEMLFRCIRAGFSMRRKTLLNSLMSLGGYVSARSNDSGSEPGSARGGRHKGRGGCDRETLLEALAAAGIDPGRRAETLTLEEFAALADVLARGRGMISGI